ncbi:MAG: hypothetical protein JW798_13220, partial [Prolixibacteraceae bacterium]|nr:hypothetical protein [Prolixibacteraceae bacterium]
DDDDPETNSFITYFGDVSDRSVSSMQTTLQDAIEENRRDRDFWVIITAAFYLLNVLDANVDAHFITFDISEDLTFNLEPFYIDHFTSTPLLGAQVSFTF